MPNFLSSGFFFRVRLGVWQELSPILGAHIHRKMEEKTPYIHRVPPKKSHWVKILAPGRNRAPKTYVNQKYQKLDYIRHFHVIPKFPLTIMRRSGAGFYEFCTIFTIFERIGSHKVCAEQTGCVKLNHTTRVVNVLHHKLHIVTDTKVT